LYGGNPVLAPGVPGAGGQGHRHCRNRSEDEPMSKPLDPASWNIETSLPKLSALTMSDELETLAEQRPDIVVLTADLATSNGLVNFQNRFPQRFINTGIAEQNMMSVAAGLAASGFTPYVST